MARRCMASASHPISSCGGGHPGGRPGHPRRGPGLFEVDPNTVLAWLMEVADHGAAFSRYFLHDLQATQRRVVGVRHRVVFGTLVGVKRVLAATGWQITTAFIERANLAIRQHVAAVGRRVMTLC